MKKYLLVLVAIFIMLSGCSTEKTATIYEQDAEYLVEIIESAHPCFVIDDIPENYEEAKMEYLEASRLVESKDDFFTISSQYCCSLKDGHTGINLEENMDQHQLQVDWYSDGTDLYLCDEGIPTKVKVLEIGGIEIEKIFETIACYEVMENESAEKLAYRIYSKTAYFLEKAGMKCDFDEKVVLTLDDGKYVEVNWKERKSTNPIYEDLETYDDIITYEIIDDVFYIDQNVCHLENSNWEIVCEELERAIENGTKKVVYDVRNNPGGDSKACEGILRAMGMTVPEFGVIIRNSKLIKETYPELYEENEPTLEIEKYKGALYSKNNSNVELIILSDEATYSSATMLCTWVQDGNLGKIVGQSSSNSPSAYGDVLSFELPNTKITGQVSSKRFIRPDTEADQRQLQVDVEVPYGMDSLKVALEILEDK